MIFVILGSQKFQFNRLLKALDEQVREKKINEPIFAQIGISDYKPTEFRSKDFLNHDEFEAMISKADIVITHGGTGAIMGAVKKRKKVIAVPRLKKYGEHVDDHQIQLITQFRKLNLICECDDCGELWKYVETVKIKEYEKYQSNTQSIINSIDNFIHEK